MTTFFVVVVLLAALGACVFLAGREEKALGSVEEYDDEDSLPYAYLYNNKKRPTW